MAACMRPTRMGSSMEIARAAVQRAQPRAHVDQAPGDQVAYAVDTFPLPFHAEQTRFQIRAALPLRHMAPHHHVDETVLVLDGDEGHPAGRLRTLALGDQAGRAYRALVRLVAQAA